jgi:hypothetical protein
MATTRTGLMTSERGENTPLPAWTLPASSNGQVALFKTEVEHMLRIGKHYNDQNVKVWQHAAAKLAKGDIRGPEGMPNNEARLRVVRQNQLQLAANKTAIIDRFSKVSRERDELQP